MASSRQGMPLLKDIKKVLSDDEKAIVKKQKQEAFNAINKHEKKLLDKKVKNNGDGVYEVCSNCGFYFINFNSTLCRYCI